MNKIISYFNYTQLFFNIFGHSCEVATRSCWVLGSSTSTRTLETFSDLENCYNLVFRLLSKFVSCFVLATWVYYGVSSSTAYLLRSFLRIIVNVLHHYALAVHWGSSKILSSVQILAVSQICTVYFFCYFWQTSAIFIESNYTVLFMDMSGKERSKNQLC